MKTRLAAPRGTHLLPAYGLPTRTTEAVGAVSPVESSADDRVALDYAGEERRKRDRRDSALPTTLDTRKSGLDRRLAGRISITI